MRCTLFLALAVLAGVSQLKEGKAVEQQAANHRGKAFLTISDMSKLERSDGAAGETVLTSQELATNLPAREIVVSWNADEPAGTGLKIEARAYCGDHYSKYYTLGLWSLDDKAYPRRSVSGQKDADGDVDTDTLILEQPASRLQIRVTLHDAANGSKPTLKFLGASLTDTHAKPTPLEPNRHVWGKEVTVPSRTQLGWPGASGWCSPTSTDMTLAFWAQKLHRPEMDLPVPEVAHTIYDSEFGGTGNWPFNTAFAGSFPGMRAYVTRFSDIRELEDWIATGHPVIVSVSYALLKGQEPINDPGHLMVCDGFTATGDIVLNDPAHHPDRGEHARRVFPRSNFLTAWNVSKYTVYLIYPEGTKLPHDAFGHWESAAH